MLSAQRFVWVCGLMMVAAAGLCLVTGCGDKGYEGPERAAVAGSVTFDGSPLPYGSITFVPSDGGGRRANAIILNGSYSIVEEQGPNLGAHKVEIIGYGSAPEQSPGGDDDEEEEEEDDEEGADEDDPNELGPQIVPANFNLETPLTAEIVSGENTHDFALTK
jgi:hypothetical protein